MGTRVVAWCPTRLESGTLLNEVRRLSCVGDCLWHSRERSVEGASNAVVGLVVPHTSDGSRDYRYQGMVSVEPSRIVITFGFERVDDGWLLPDAIRAEVDAAGNVQTTPVAQAEVDASFASRPSCEAPPRS
jgi:hypothetical protein